MIRSTLSIGILLLWTASAFAQTSLTIRSGEHDTFTRLTLTIGERWQWRVTPSAGTLEVRMSESFEEFDISTVFSRINRSRIAELNPQTDSRGLDIGLNCDCGFRAYVEGGDLLVVDIGEGLPKQNSVGSPGFTLPVMSRPEVLRPDAVLPVVTERQHARQAFDAMSQMSAPNRTRPPIPNAVDLSEPEGTSLQPDESAEDRNALERVVQEITKAQKQGLLIGSGQEAASELSQPPNNSGSAVSNIRMRKSQWDDVADLVHDDQTQDGTICPPIQWFDIAEWAHPQGFSAGVGEWSLQLTREFDVIDEEAVFSLARHYLHFGFGAEADATLRLLGDTSPERETLSALARIVDEGHDPAHGPMSGMMSCNGPPALWSTLSYTQLPRHADMNIPDVRLSFDALPRHLRTQLAPVLANKLAAAGKPEVAEAILASLSRAPEPESPDLDLAQAKLGIERGDSGTAIQSLETVAQSNSDASQEALILLVDNAVAQGHEINQELIDLVALALFENRRSPLAAELSRVHTLALAHGGQFTAAFSELARLTDDADHLNAIKTVSQVMARLVSHASDMDFLLNTLNAPILPHDSAVENATARRLLRLGFPEAARQTLRGPADRQAQKERRELRAEAALALGQPLEAEAELLGVEGPGADLLRVRAREMVQDYAAALRNTNSADPSETRRDLAWLAGDWSALAASGEDSISQAARLALSRNDDEIEDPAEPAAEGILRQSRELIADSQESRALLEELLADFSLDLDAAP